MVTIQNPDLWRIGHVLPERFAIMRHAWPVGLPQAGYTDISTVEPDKKFNQCPDTQLVRVTVKENNARPACCWV